MSSIQFGSPDWIEESGDLWPTFPVAVPVRGVLRLTPTSKPAPDAPVR
jgi:hypothetical protein